MELDYVVAVDVVNWDVGVDGGVAAVGVVVVVVTGGAFDGDAALGVVASGIDSMH